MLGFAVMTDKFILKPQGFCSNAPLVHEVSTLQFL